MVPKTSPLRVTGPGQPKEQGTGGALTPTAVPPLVVVLVHLNPSLTGGFFLYPGDVPGWWRG